MALLLMAASACTPAIQESHQAVATNEAKSQAENLQEETMLTSDQQVDGAVAQLALQLDIAPGDIEIVQAHAVNWGSSAIGCPREGMSYTQAIVPGLLVILRANGNVYRYHGAEGKPLFHCPEDRAQAPAFGPGEAIR